MATVPPADRTSPRLDPRYDPVFQRGYTSERTAEPRPLASSQAGGSAHAVPSPRPGSPLAVPSPRPGSPLADPRGLDESDAVQPGAPTLPGSADVPAEEQTQVTASAAPPRPQPRTGLLWLVSAALIVAGVLLHFAFGAAGYGVDWSVSTEGGAIRFADGRSVEQVLATQLAVAVAPQLVVLGIATAVATLFLSTFRSERGTR